MELREQLTRTETEIEELKQKVGNHEEMLTDLASEEEEDAASHEITLVEILESPEVTKAVNTAVDAWASTRPDDIVCLRPTSAAADESERAPLFPNWNSGILAYNLTRPISFDFPTMRNESLRDPVGAQDRLRLYAESV